ncbi:DUF2804 domain-containing protein [Roseateles sp.]|uniref:DUF2804 domain-containing protein n=1 Tax=Roseateles sp. TaxID=1971397 RepID=UPI00326478CE
MAIELKPAPAAVVIDGQPAHGRYAGSIARIDWSPLNPRPSWLWRRLHNKRWHYVGLGNDAVFIGVAIVDVGWACSAFAYLFDRQDRSLLADWSQDGFAGLQAGVSDAPLAGADSWFRGPGARLSLRHEAGDRLHLHVATRTLRVEAELDLAAMAPPLLAIGPIEGGPGAWAAEGIARVESGKGAGKARGGRGLVPATTSNAACALARLNPEGWRGLCPLPPTLLVHATQKTSALPVRGWAEAQGRRFALDSAWAAVDASNGLLARDTAWRWASAHRPDIGFNLQQGYFGAQENVLWLDGQPAALSAAHFDFAPEQPLSPWRIHTSDGLLDLVFTPEGARAANKHLGFAASRYVQPVGTFSGAVNGRTVTALPGVTEDHRSLW